MLALCHSQLAGQTLTDALPPARENAAAEPFPEDPGEEILPVAELEPTPTTGIPVHIEAQRQTRAGDDWTLSGQVVVHYRDYILRSDKAVYHPSTTVLEAEGHLQVAGGPEDALLEAERGEMRLNAHTARFFNVTGSLGVRRAGRTTVYSTPNPFLFSGRVLLQTGEGKYRIIDGTMTNCRLPKPDWQLFSHSIELADGKASTANSIFKFLGLPLFYLPYLRHPVDETGRQSGLLIPVFPSNYNSIRGYTLGEQVYWVISRNMDMVAGTDLYTKRGWAPNGDFRYKGPGLDHLTARWNALLDRGIEQTTTVTTGTTATATTTLVNQGGVDIVALGRKDITPNTRVAGIVEYLSNYVYRLVFNDNYSQATSSEVASAVSLTHQRNGFIPSASLDRFQTFAGSANGDQARILHLPNIRYDVLQQPLSASPLYWGLGSSLAYLSRSEPRFHARNVGRIDFYPHLSLPLAGGGWSAVPEVALRETSYTISQIPDLAGFHGEGTPSISHDALNRAEVEAALDLRPPALEREFALTRWNRQLRHVIEPQFTYRYVGGIGAAARNVLLVDTDDIATDTDELGYSITQRFYLRSTGNRSCNETDPKGCPPQGAREWASWRIAQKFFLDPNFGGALIPNRRNVFDSTLDLSAVAFLTSPRNLSPVISRLRFEAIDNLRIQWDLDYDPKTGKLDADNVYAGYSWGRSTAGLGYAMLNAVDENAGAASTIQSRQVQPFLSFGKPSAAGLNLAANAGYDFALGQLQYATVQAIYNWNCCGLTFGYRRLDLGAVRGNDTQYLYGFTLANFGSVGDVRRANSAFRDPNLPPAY
jgi:LPS-assembly protein